MSFGIGKPAADTPGQANKWLFLHTAVLSLYLQKTFLSYLFH